MKGSQKRKIIASLGKRCVKCGATERLTLDHVVPKFWGGTLRNRQVLCFQCNLDKSVLPIDYRTRTFIIQPAMLAMPPKMIAEMLRKPDVFQFKFNHGRYTDAAN